MKKIFIILALIFLSCREPIDMESVIIEKLYAPSHYHHVSDYDTDENYHNDNEYTPDKYILVFWEYDNIIELEVSKNHFYRYDKGDKIKYTSHWYGRVLK
jgi:hypothetical protein